MRVWSASRVFCGTFRCLRMISAAAANRRLEGKVAIVTASTEGIGFGIAKQLVRDGAKVMISSRKQSRVTNAVSKLEKEEQGCAVRGVVCHVGKPEHRKNLVEETLHHFGGIDILVSNAAANPAFGPILQTSEDAWEKIFDINVKSAFLLAKDVIPQMEKRGGGSVVFISSIAGYQPMQLHFHVPLWNEKVRYCATPDTKKTLKNYCLDVARKYVETYSTSNAVALDLEEEVE